MDKLTLFRGIPITKIFVEYSNHKDIAFDKKRFKPNKDLSMLVVTETLPESSLITYTKQGKDYHSFLIEGFVVQIVSNMDNINRKIPFEIKKLKNSSNYIFYWHNSLSSWVNNVGDNHIRIKSPWVLVKHKGKTLAVYREKAMNLLSEPSEMSSRFLRNSKANCIDTIIPNSLLNQARTISENMTNMVKSSVNINQETRFPVTIDLNFDSDEASTEEE